MKTVYSGFLNEEQQSYPCLIADTGETLESIDKINNRFAQFAKNILSSTNDSISDHYHAIDAPSVWGGNADVEILADGGFCISVDGFTAKSSAINGNGVIATNHYMTSKAPKNAALYFHLRTSNSDDYAFYNKISCSNGTIFKIMHERNTILSTWFLSNDGVAYFAFDAPSQIQFGKFGANNVIFNPIGKLEPYKLYMLASFLGVAQGMVKDKAGKPMSNCRLGAFVRKDFHLVGVATSNESGRYRMPIAAAKGEQIFIVCLDNDDTPDFEALIYDRIQVL